MNFDDKPGGTYDKNGALKNFVHKVVQTAVFIKG
jgi:hypothetical protein